MFLDFIYYFISDEGLSKYKLGIWKKSSSTTIHKNVSKNYYIKQTMCITICRIKSIHNNIQNLVILHTTREYFNYEHVVIVIQILYKVLFLNDFKLVHYRYAWENYNILKYISYWCYDSIILLVVNTKIKVALLIITSI